MSGVPADRTETRFRDDKPAYTDDQAAIEANRCLYCYDAPCVGACPTGIDIPGFIRKIATGNVKGAARTIFAANILGQSCARVCPVDVLCVGDCVYNEKDVPPIQIGRLQRYATDAAVDGGWRFATAGPDTGKHVAVVGGGPASLACAHQLRVYGHRVTLYEKRPVVGGLNVTGVAPHKLRADDAATEVDWVLGIGGIAVERREVDAGALVELVATADAVFLGLGLGADSRLGVPGEDLPGVHGAVDWIERMKLSRVSLEGVTHAAVIGGGNTAMDCVRELCTLGVPCVRLVYRGGEDDMSGYTHEWEAARVQGTEAVWHSQPVSFEGEGRVQRVRCAVTGPDKRPIPGRELTVEAELVLVATGQAKLGALVAGVPGVGTDKGRIVTDAQGRTSHPKVWAGGDCANGGKEVVNAVAEGRDAAHAIHRMLMGAP